MNTELATRRERLAEAIESLILATLETSMLDEARKEFRDAFDAAVAPVFRIVEGGLDKQAVPPVKLIAEPRKLGVQQPETFEICRVCDMPNEPGIYCPVRHCPNKSHA